MRTEHLKFPLHAEQTIPLPKGCKITGVKVENDITFLIIENPNLLALTTITADASGMRWPNGKPVETQDHRVFAYFEGDYRVSREEDGTETKTFVQIPEETETLREIAVFETVDIAAKWHVMCEEVNT